MVPISEPAYEYAREVGGTPFTVCVSGTGWQGQEACTFAAQRMGCGHGLGMGMASAAATPALHVTAEQVRAAIRKAGIHVDADCSDRKMQKKVGSSCTMGGALEGMPGRSEVALTWWRS